MIYRRYAPDPRRILAEHQPRWWQRIVRRCRSGARRPCLEFNAALHELLMRRRGLW